MDPDSPLHADLMTYKEKEGKDHILMNFTYKVNILQICLNHGIVVAAIFNDWTAAESM